jgi:hypothetical protein
MASTNLPEHLHSFDNLSQNFGAELKGLNSKSGYRTNTFICSPLYTKERSTARIRVEKPLTACSSGVKAFISFRRSVK